jgi:hypothetical protein
VTGVFSEFMERVLGLPAVISPSRGEKGRKTAIGAAHAKESSNEML